MLHTATYENKISEFLRKKHKYMSPLVQNSLMDLMSQQIVRQIIKSVNEEKFYCIMVDETADISNKEQMVLCLRLDRLIVSNDTLGVQAICTSFSEP